MKNYKLLFYTFFVLSPLISFSQKVSNIHFEQVGKKIHIYYDLEGDQEYTITPYMSMNNGKNWAAMDMVAGDVGESQKVGNNKLIIWDVLTDDYYGDIDFVGNVTFRIDAVISSAGYFIDERDGKRYRWVHIGNQVWMAENLNIGERINGNIQMKNNGKIEKYCYDDKEINCHEYGGLYQWDEMMNYNSQESIQGICPDGWHLPSDNEWRQLEMYLGMNEIEVSYRGIRGSDEGGKLKSSCGWDNCGNGANNSGFAGLPGGEFTGVVFFNIGKEATWWTSSTENVPFWRSLYYDNLRIGRNRAHTGYGFSVRCLKD